MGGSRFKKETNAQSHFENALARQRKPLKCEA
jgi:hypothetical protein